MAYPRVLRLLLAALVPASIAVLGGLVAYGFAENHFIQVLAILGFVSLGVYAFSLLAIGEVEKRFGARGVSLVLAMGAVTLASGFTILLFVLLTITGMRWEYRLLFPIIAVVVIVLLPVFRSYQKKRTKA